MMSELFTVWSDSPAISLAIWLVIAILLLYAGRPQAHLLLRTAGRALYRSLRLAATGVRQLEQRVSARNRDVLLAMGREHAEKAIEREFDRVGTLVERDLSHYPVLHRALKDTLEKVQADYHAATDEAPLPPAWNQVMDTIAALPNNGDPAVTRILEEIRAAVEESHQQTLKAYQKSAGERHRILSGMQPQWRSLNQTMSRVEQTITGLESRAKVIDRQMADYESLRKAEDRAVHALTASSLTQFFIASLVLVIATFGGIINFHLIAMPMSEMVGGASTIGSVRTSDIAALVIIMVEIAMGIFLLEALGITRLFPLIGSMDDRMRKRMAIAAFTILVIFASIEASLAYMRDLLALDREALQQSLTGAEASEAAFRWIPSVGQLLLGFILPFALAFVAIPLEAFVHSLRTLLGLLAVGLLRVLRLALRILGGAAHHGSQMLIHAYDIFVMLPLSLERLINHWRAEQRQQRAAERETTDAAEDTPVEPKPARKRRERASTADMNLTPGEA